MMIQVVSYKLTLPQAKLTTLGYRVNGIRLAQPFWSQSQLLLRSKMMIKQDTVIISLLCCSHQYPVIKQVVNWYPKKEDQANRNETK